MMVAQAPICRLESGSDDKLDVCFTTKTQACPRPRLLRDGVCGRLLSRIHLAFAGTRLSVRGSCDAPSGPVRAAPTFNCSGDPDCLDLVSW